jgi:hypothetical protein
MSPDKVSKAPTTAAKLPNVELTRTTIRPGQDEKIRERIRRQNEKNQKKKKGYSNMKMERKNAKTKAPNKIDHDTNRKK